MSPAAEMLRLLCILLFLPPVHPAHSHKGTPGLLCTNDFVNNVSCSWTSSWLGAAEDCWISGKKKIWNIDFKPYFMIRTCKLKRLQNSSLGCSFVFENREFHGSELLPITLTCNNTLVEEMKNYEPEYHIKMQPPTAPTVNITANYTLISWSLKSVSRYFQSGFSFQLQVKQREEQWKDSRKFSTNKQELRFPVGELKGHMEARVQVMPLKRYNSHWSDWSPTASWVDLEDRKDWSPDQYPVKWILLPLGLCLVAVVVLANYKICKTRGLLKGKQVPNPSGYFETLHSVHQGNLKEWLNPLSETQSFCVTPSCDQISHVVVCEDWNESVHSPSLTSTSTSTLFHFHRYPTTGSDTNAIIYNSSSLSSFSNKGYFMSSSSGGSARTNPNPAYFTYHDSFQNLPHIHIPHLSPSDPLTSCPEYESLKREPESPDSGFGIMKDDEIKETQRVTCGEGEEVLKDQSSPLRFFPLQLPSHPPSFPSAHPSTLTQPSESQPMDVADTDTSGGLAAQLGASAMCRSSSMPVEPFKNGYLTLKELQMTFSNKSI
uniref:Interleukin-2 receptor subunit beta n=1 Tax=Fundulus heteroclitus TaxID=8078 RepID=A0A3Q2PB56_FUNHE